MSLRWLGWQVHQVRSTCTSSSSMEVKVSSCELRAAVRGTWRARRAGDGAASTTHTMPPATVSRLQGEAPTNEGGHCHRKPPPSSGIVTAAVRARSSAIKRKVRCANSVRGAVCGVRGDMRCAGVPGAGVPGAGCRVAARSNNPGLVYSWHTTERRPKYSLCLKN